jgi:hypothetical protein
MTSSRKDIDLRKHREPDLVAALFHPTEDLRQAAFREICARGEKRGWEAFSFLTQDPELAGRFASIKDQVCEPVAISSVWERKTSCSTALATSKATRSELLAVAR